MPDSKSKIVLLDDNEINSTLGRNILGTFFEVYPAPTADSFFEILEKLTPDLILLDMKPPELERDDAIQKIKADTRFTYIPVILLGSQKDESNELEGFKLGAADCIAKPFSGSSLLKRIINQLLIVQKDKITVASGKAAEKVVEKLNALAGKKRQGGKYASRPF